jgi:hypothetical protein
MAARLRSVEARVRAACERRVTRKPVFRDSHSPRVAATLANPWTIRLPNKERQTDVCNLLTDGPCPTTLVGKQQAGHRLLNFSGAATNRVAMWWCHACATHFTTDLSMEATEVKCTVCNESFVEFMPHAVPALHDEEDDGYDDDDEYDGGALQNFFFNAPFLFGDGGLRGLVDATSGTPSPPPANAGASEEAMDALPSVHLTAEHVASEPEVRASAHRSRAARGLRRPHTRTHTTTITHNHNHAQSTTPHTQHININISTHTYTRRPPLAGSALYAVRDLQRGL